MGKVYHEYLSLWKSLSLNLNKNCLDLYGDTTWEYPKQFFQLVISLPASAKGIQTGLTIEYMITYQNMMIIISAFNFKSSSIIYYFFKENINFYFIIAQCKI